MHSCAGEGVKESSFYPQEDADSVSQRKIQSGVYSEKPLRVGCPDSDRPHLSPRRLSFPSKEKQAQNRAPLATPCVTWEWAAA